MRGGTPRVMGLLQGTPGVKRIIEWETLAQGTLYAHGPWTPGLYSACVFCRHLEDDDLLAGFMYF